MNVALAIFGSVLGLSVTAASFYTAWAVRQLGKERETAEERAALAARLFLRWTVYDAAVLALFGCGLLLLVADLVGVLRDRAAYPLYHYAYLLCGVVFSALGMLFVLVRLAIVLQTGHTASAAGLLDGSANGNGAAPPHHHHEPGHTD
jgi:hypothetical protein